MITLLISIGRPCVFRLFQKRDPNRGVMLVCSIQLSKGRAEMQCAPIRKRGLLALPLALLLSVPISGCQSNDLTREAAAQVLSQANFGTDTKVISASLFTASGGFIPPIKEEIDDFQNYVFGSDSTAQAILQKYNAGGMSNMYMRSSLGGLNDFRDHAQKGLVGKMKWMSRSAGFQNLQTVFAIPEMSDKLQGQCTKKEVSDVGFSCTIITATRKFGAVTGIFGDSRQKRVDFEVIYTPTELGRSLGLQEAVERRSTTFLKYDDGWRLAR